MTNKERNRPDIVKAFEKVLIEHGQTGGNAHKIPVEITADYLLDQLDIFLDAAYRVRQVKDAGD